MAPQTSGVPSGRADPPPVGLDGGVPTLFVYGTLRHPPLLERLIGRAPTAEPASLEGWRAARLRDLPYPGLVRDPDARAQGALVEVDADELSRLDRFEGPMYERIRVTVHAHREVPGVHVWRLRPEHQDLVTPRNWDLEEFLVDDSTWFLGGGPG